MRTQQYPGATDAAICAVPAGCWIAVACADHVRRGVEASFMRVCHGKAAPLRRLSPGDGVAYYTPSSGFGGTDKLMTFTAYGRLKDADPYPVEMGRDFRPFRRDVGWEGARMTPIRPLPGALTFASEGGIGATSSASDYSGSTAAIWK